jgi:hypothetical protein
MAACIPVKRCNSVFGKINYGGLKHNSLYLGLVLPSGECQSLIEGQTNHLIFSVKKSCITLTLCLQAFKATLSASYRFLLNGFQML